MLYIIILCTIPFVRVYYIICYVYNNIILVLSYYCLLAIPPKMADGNDIDNIRT